MMRRILFSTLVLLLLCAAPASALDFPWGIKAGASFKPDQFTFAYAHVAEPLRGWRITPDVFLGFGDDVTVLQLDGDFVYTFPELKSSDWGFYVGGGLGWATYFTSGNNSGEIGLNIIGGVTRSLDNGNELLAEIRIGIDDLPDFKILVGYTIF